MALAPGTQIGPYEVAGALGAGGMGEVYRAHDSRLKRDVALKVLPESFAADPERLARFQREAEVLASLNHPHIAGILGLEESDGTKALVLELVEGETLADRIARGPIPVDEALALAKQIAEALEAAHEHGVIHRDLKPANIKITPDGVVKVLDFGLAKLTESPAAESGAPTLSQSPTITSPAAMTGVGMLLGTAAYMSPEQARGSALDRRADVWAFGVVLWEMLTGARLFDGKTVSDTLAGVLKTEPNLDVLPRDTPPRVRQALTLCLQKEIADRIGDMHDVRLALGGAFETAPTQVAPAVVIAQPLWQQALPVAAALVVGGLVVGLAAWGLRAATEPLSVNRFAYVVPNDQLFRNLNRPVMALSPDGRSFVYNTTDGLYLRTMGELEARLIPGTEETLVHPIFSPDGQSVAYVTVDGLKRIALSGGASIVIAEGIQLPNGANWAWDDTIFFGQADGIYRVPATGDTPALVIPAEAGETFDGARLLPDGDTVLFTVTTTADWDDAQIVVASLASGERTVVLEGGSDARYLPTGHLVYALGNNLLGIGFDLDTLSVTGGAVPLAQGVRRANASAGANYGISTDGTLVYMGGGGIGQSRLVWVYREAREEAINIPPQTYTAVRLSPDGTRAAVATNDDQRDIWIVDLATGGLTRLTFDPSADTSPVWTPDGQRVAFSSARAGAVNLFWRASNGTGAVERLTESPNTQGALSFSPDGMRLVFDELSQETSRDLHMLLLNEERQSIPLVVAASNIDTAEVSPDGRWIAYESLESGQDEIFVRPFPDVESGRWQVSADGGQTPLWSADGTELFYSLGRTLMEVQVQADETFAYSAPQTVFSATYPLRIAGGRPDRAFDVSPDGERFLMIKPDTDGTDVGSQTDIVVVENWFTELERLIPTN